MTIGNIAETNHRLIHRSLVSEISLLVCPLDQPQVCIKTVIKRPPKPHSTLRELEILRIFRDLYPHPNIIKFISEEQRTDDWVITFPYYKHNLKEIMLKYWEWYIPYESSAPTKKKYLDNLLTSGMSKEKQSITNPLDQYEQAYKSNNQPFTLSKSHFLVNKTPVYLIHKIFNDILAALKHLSKHKIMHRDIKPENILYDEQCDLFILIDFGISTSFKGARSHVGEVKEAMTSLDLSLESYVKEDILQVSKNTCPTPIQTLDKEDGVDAGQEGEPLGYDTDLLHPDGITDIGTSIYKPLEALIGIKDYDNRVDIWALMVLMHQLCVPFVSAYKLDEDDYDTGHYSLDVGERIQRVCDEYNDKNTTIPEIKHELNYPIGEIPSVFDDGRYLVANQYTGKMVMCEGSDISLLSSIHKVLGCPMQAQYPMGLESVAWVFMYNNNDKPDRVYFEDDPKREEFIRKYMFGLVQDKKTSDMLVKMCHFDYSKRFNVD